MYTIVHDHTAMPEPFQHFNAERLEVEAHTIVAQKKKRSRPGIYWHKFFNG